jgi:hypothetical protein
LVASPVQALRAAMRLYARGLGRSGFTLCLLDFCTGGRWSELGGQERHEYDGKWRAIAVRAPLKEVVGKLLKRGARVNMSPDVVIPVPAAAPRRRGRQKKGWTKTPVAAIELPATSLATHLGWSER